MDRVKGPFKECHRSISRISMNQGCWTKGIYMKLSRKMKLYGLQRQMPKPFREALTGMYTKHDEAATAIMDG